MDANPHASHGFHQPIAGPYVIAFFGEHANDMLRWWTARIMDGLAAHGLAHTLIDLTVPGWRDTLADCLAHRTPEFVFSFQGVAMDVRLANENFWARNAIPFLSYMGDSPAHAPALHAAHGPGLYLLYGCEDFLHAYQTVLQGRAYATTLPYSYPPNPHAEATPWTARTHDAVFVKTGVDPQTIRSAWATLPRTLHAVLEDASAAVLSGIDEPVTKVAAAAFAHHGIHPGDRRELVLHAASTIDRYARAVRAQRMVQALLGQNVLIVGDWPHIDTGPRGHTRTRARLVPPVPAHTLDALYADSRVVVNTSPTVRRGMHERIMAGLLARAAVLSDTTPYLARLLEPCPAFLGLNIDDPAFMEAAPATLEAALADPGMPAMTAASQAFAAHRFSFPAFIQRLLDHVAIERHRRTLDAWAFPPPPHTLAPLAA